ncbi:hypothetical protein BDY19DRAFT_905586 [Irpex rosettiformis]|uniref:Uncharacterized protein n=1 Tax=Irpex rosettiformis TaxID=378272 RepID=A0ACB8U6W4_9APHY|nr:hypothetical protein BDY19DRAFT_905586 [Irpex rosettiformis]
MVKRRYLMIKRVLYTGDPHCEVYHKPGSATKDVQHDRTDSVIDNVASTAPAGIARTVRGRGNQAIQTDPEPWEKLGTDPARLTVYAGHGRRSSDLLTRRAAYAATHLDHESERVSFNEVVGSGSLATLIARSHYIRVLASRVNHGACNPFAKKPLQGRCVSHASDSKLMQYDKSKLHASVNNGYENKENRPYSSCATIAVPYIVSPNTRARKGISRATHPSDIHRELRVKYVMHSSAVKSFNVKWDGTNKPGCWVNTLVQDERARLALITAATVVGICALSYVWRTTIFLGLQLWVGTFHKLEILPFDADLILQDGFAVGVDVIRRKLHERLGVSLTYLIRRSAPSVATKWKKKKSLRNEI